MKKRYIIIITIIVIIIIRLVLPTLVKDYVNKVLNNLEGYKGKIEDVDLALIKGAYTIEGINLEKIENKQPVPFIDISELHLSIDWNAIFNGSIVGEIRFVAPKINFVDDNKQEKAEAESDSTNWVEILKQLIPLKINKLEVEDGQISFLNFASKPKVDLKLENLQILATNISNVEDELDPLPSSLSLRGNILKKGKLSMNMRMNFLQEIPDLDADLSLEDVNMIELNDFFNVYANFDVEKGNFSLYNEIVIKDGKLEGYIKPIFEDVKIFSLQKDIKEGNFFQSMWEGLLGLFSEGLENQPKDQVATKIPVSGDLNSPDTEIWPMLTNIFRNAFVEAFSKQVEGEVEFQ